MADIFSPKGAGVFQQRSPIDLFQARNGSKSNEVSDRLIATLKKAGAANIEALEEKHAKNKETQLQLETLKRQSDPAEARKARAREKIEQIKKQLEALRMLANIDPEAAARQAARLSRELAAAVREYASAGGDAGALTGANVPSTPADTTAAGGAETAGADAAPATAGVPQADVSPGGGETAGKNSAQTGKTGTDGGPVLEDQTGAKPAEPENTAQPAQAGENESGKVDAPEDTHPDRARAEAFQELFAEQQKSSSESRSEREFADEIKKLKRELESLIERGSDDEANGREAKELKDGLRALKDIDHALVAMSSPISASLGAINIIA